MIIVINNWYGDWGAKIDLYLITRMNLSDILDFREHVCDNATSYNYVNMELLFSQLKIDTMGSEYEISHDSSAQQLPGEMRVADDRSACGHPKSPGGSRTRKRTAISLSLLAPDAAIPETHPSYAHPKLPCFGHPESFLGIYCPRIIYERCERGAYIIMQLRQPFARPLLYALSRWT